MKSPSGLCETTQERLEGGSCSTCMVRSKRVLGTHCQLAVALRLKGFVPRRARVPRQKGRVQLRAGHGGIIHLEDHSESGVTQGLDPKNGDRKVHIIICVNHRIF